MFVQDSGHRFQNSLNILYRFCAAYKKNDVLVLWEAKVCFCQIEFFGRLKT